MLADGCNRAIQVILTIEYVYSSIKLTRRIRVCFVFNRAFCPCKQFLYGIVVITIHVLQIYIIAANIRIKQSHLRVVHLKPLK